MIVYRRRDAGDILASILVFIVFSIFITMIAIYIGSIVLGVFLGVGVIIGLVYSIIVYIKAIIKVASTFTYPRGKDFIISFLLRWFYLFVQISKVALIDNYNIARGALSRFLAYRLFSFKKWMWLIVVPSTMFFGIAVVFISILIQCAIFIQFACIFCFVCLIVSVVEILIGIILSLIKFIPISFKVVCKYNLFRIMNFRRGIGIKGTKNFVIRYYKVVHSLLKELWYRASSIYRTYISHSNQYAVFNFKRFCYYMFSVALLIAVTVVTVILSLIYLIIFIVLLIVQFLWSLVSYIYR